MMFSQINAVIIYIIAFVISKQFLNVFIFFSESITTPEKKVVESPVKDKKVPDSPAKKVESPVKEKAAENGSAKAEEEDDEVKENGASEEEEEDVEKEQNGDTKGMCFS